METRGGEWSDVSALQGMPNVARSPLELGERRGMDAPRSLQEGPTLSTSCSQTSGLQNQKREYSSVVLHPSACVNLSCVPRTLTHPPPQPGVSLPCIPTSCWHCLLAGILWRRVWLAHSGSAGAASSALSQWTLSTEDRPEVRSCPRLLPTD